MGLDGEAEESVLKIEEEIHKKTSVGSTRFRQKNENKIRCISLCDRWCIIYRIQRWKVETSNTSLQISQWNRKKLQDLWQEDIKIANFKRS